MEDVKAIFRQAADEQLIENTLKNVEEVWFSKRFQFDDYRFVANYEYLNKQQAELDYLITARLQQQSQAGVPGAAAQLRASQTPAASRPATASSSAAQRRQRAKSARSSRSYSAARARSHTSELRAPPAASAEAPGRLPSAAPRDDASNLQAHSRQSRSLSLISLPLSVLNLAMAEHQALDAGEAIEEVEGEDSEEPDVRLTSLFRSDIHTLKSSRYSTLDTLFSFLCR